ncbi:MAG: hypothetical protein R2838_00975 [Caldilineaceae bacterium]
MIVAAKLGGVDDVALAGLLTVSSANLPRLASCSPSSNWLR